MHMWLTKSVVRLSHNPKYKGEGIFSEWQDFCITPHGEQFTSPLLETLTYANTLWPDQYGLRIFEGVMAYRVQDETGKNIMKIFRLTDHVDRLFASAEKLQTQITHTKQEVRAAMLRAAQQHTESDMVYLRPTARSNYKYYGIDPSKTPFEEVLIEAQPFSYLAQGLEVGVYPGQRLNKAAFDISAKISWNYANSAMGKLWANKNGYNEALFLDEDSNIAELSGANIFFIQEDKIITPTTDNIFAWLTRDTVIKLLQREKGIAVHERPISVEESKLFYAAFATWTAAEIKEITRINNEDYKNSALPGHESLSFRNLKFIQDVYKNISRGNTQNYKGHLAYQQRLEGK